MANETLHALRVQVRRALANAAKHRRAGDRDAAADEQARARRLETSILRLQALRPGKRKGAA